MVRFELIEENDFFQEYRYYPENSETDYGLIRFSKEGHGEVTKAASTDPYGNYAIHVLSAIRNGQKCGIVAWY